MLAVCGVILAKYGQTSAGSIFLIISVFNFYVDLVCLKGLFLKLQALLLDSILIFIAVYTLILTQGVRKPYLGWIVIYTYMIAQYCVLGLASLDFLLAIIKKVYGCFKSLRGRKKRVDPNETDKEFEELFSKVTSERFNA